MDSERGKLFVGRIPSEMKEEALKEHFENYGEVSETVVVRDSYTGNGKGFGFVSFSDPSDADKALREKHVMLGRIAVVKRAIPRSEKYKLRQNEHQQQMEGPSRNGSSGSDISSYSNGAPFRTKKIFVGGVSSNLTEKAFRSHFEKFGRITDVVLMYDSATQRPRGFGFITFDSEESVDAVVQYKFHQLNDKLVEVKRAVPKGRSKFNNGYKNINYDVKMGNRRVTPFGTYHNVSPYDPPLGVFPAYALNPVLGYISAAAGGYPYGIYRAGGYNGVGYNSPILQPGSPWSDVGNTSYHRSPMPYGHVPSYPSYVNGCPLGFVWESSVGGYSGFGCISNGESILGANSTQTNSLGSSDGSFGTATQLTDDGNLENGANSLGRSSSMQTDNLGSSDGSTGTATQPTDDGNLENGANSLGRSSSTQTDNLGSSDGSSGTATQLTDDGNPENVAISLGRSNGGAAGTGNGIEQNQGGPDGQFRTCADPVA